MDVLSVILYLPFQSYLLLISICSLFPSPGRRMWCSRRPRMTRSRLSILVAVHLAQAAWERCPWGQRKWKQHPFASQSIGLDWRHARRKGSLLVERPQTSKGPTAVWGSAQRPSFPWLAWRKRRRFWPQPSQPSQLLKPLLSGLMLMGKISRSFGRSLSQ